MFPREPDLGQISARLRWRVNGAERLAKVVGEWVGGGDGVLASLNLYGAVAAGGLDEFPD